MHRNGSELDLALEPAAVANTIEPLLHMVERDLGIACLPDLLIRPQLESRTLTTVLDEHVDHTGMFRILWPPSRHLSPKLRAFLDFVCNHFPT